MSDLELKQPPHIQELVEIRGFPNYRVSVDGRIFKVDGLYRSQRVKEPIELRTHAHSNGYLQLSIREGGARVRIYVHQAVATAFCHRKPQDTEVRHLDGRISNNHFTNLKWGTRSENALDMVGHGRSMRGEKNAKAKLTRDQVQAIRRMAISQRNIAAIFGVSQGNIGFIKRGETWKHI